ncbi:hypothetical protein DMP17_00900 [Pseudonocardia sp. TMWB2A]|uniref:MvaI/BcnI family restriction endonuclease n=1 Tax=Pseudonocardia sp. TMWB2A TaxID=687430 RepID=UPI00307E0FFE
MTISLDAIIGAMREIGASRIYAKILAPNDNSKNQIYLGGDFSALNIIPHGEIEIDTSILAGSKQPRPKAKVDFRWIDENGSYPAPHAQLVLYPDYPEVRMSGFLRNCAKAPSDVMSVRDVGRVLILGITQDRRVLGYAAATSSAVATEVRARRWDMIGVFVELPISTVKDRDTKDILLERLKQIHQRKWIPSQKLGVNGNKDAYSARNGGGYTLEAELGIRPNGDAEPDFMGWEVKQYGVNNFQKFLPKSPVTLMTPEPTGGVYKDDGVASFLKSYGYADKSGKADRINFGGVYSYGKMPHSDTGLKLNVAGFDAAKGKITDINGGLQLLDLNDEIAASWSFQGLLEHWNRKHAQAAYIPSIFDAPPPRYAYGNRVMLCEGTDFILFLKAVVAGVIYYDPAIKLEGVSKLTPAIKRRSQFRIKHQYLATIYHQNEIIDLI